ncbi:hypothetical protein [Kribbella sp. NPDC049227]|uniref:hypothetical protein n=1 Tax=Kribbella sp. NPDC049227 TaxID=3364113 RepID=UPI00370FD164
MLTTVLLALVAGFFVGNGLPYYMLGSTGNTNPTPFGQSAAVNVVVGWVAFVIAAICWRYAHVSGHPLAGYAAAAVGLLAVGLIHAELAQQPMARPQPVPPQEHELMLTTIRLRLPEGCSYCRHSRDRRP